MISAFQNLGRYQLLGELGAGGMGVVYLARDPRLGRLVALKLIRPGLLDSRETHARLQIEAQAAGSFKHPNIVSIYEVGTFDSNPPQPYLAMQYVSGGSLAERLTEGPLPPMASAKLMGILARAVEQAHQRGILHRDLKPSNILLDEDGEPHLSDFGLAKFLASDQGLTLSHAPLGTCGYMAPEVVREGARAATIASDIYSLGAVLYELIAGRPPYVTRSLPDFLLQIERSDPLSPLAAAAATSNVSPRSSSRFLRDLECICLRSLSRDPAQRYSSAGALADDLDRLQRGDPILARPPRAREAVSAWVRRHRLASAVGATATIALLVGLATTLWQWIRAEDFLVGARLANAELTQSDIRFRLAEYERQSADGFHPTALQNLTLLSRQHPTNEAVAVRLWSALSSRAHPLRLLPPLPHGGEPSEAAFTADGRHLLTTDTGSVHLWDIPSGHLVGSLPHDERVAGLLLSRDGHQLLTMPRDAGLAAWTLPDLRPIPGPWNQTNPSTGAALAPSGRWMAATTAEGLLRVWSLDPPALAWEKQLVRPATMLRFTGDDSTLLVGDGVGDAFVFVAANGQPCSDSPLYLSGLQGIEPASRGPAIALAGSNSFLFLPDPARAGPSLSRTFTNELIRALCFSPDGGRLLVATTGPELREYELSSGKLTGRFPPVPADKDAACYRSDGLMLGVATSDGLVWLLSGDPSVRSYEPVRAGVFAFSITFSPDGRTVAIPSHPSSVQVFQLDSPFAQEALELVETNAVTVVLSPDADRVLMVDRQKQVGIRRLNSGSVFEPWFKLEGELRSAAFSPSCRWLLMRYAGGSATLRDLSKAGEVPRRLELGSPFMPALAFDNDEARLALATTNEVYVWNIGGSAPRLLVRIPAANIQFLDFSSDGTRFVLAVAPAWAAKLYDTSTWKEVSDGIRHAGPIGIVRFSRDGQFLATAAQDRTVRIWNASDGQPLSPFFVNGNDGLCMDLRPGGQELFTGSSGLSVRRWQVPTGYPEAREFTTRGAPHTLACSPSGQVLVCAHESGVQCWDIDSGTSAMEPLDLGRLTVPQFARDGRRLWLLPMRIGPQELVTLRLPVSDLPPRPALLAYAQLVLDGTLDASGGLEPFTADTFHRIYDESAPILKAPASPRLTRLRLQQ